MNHLFRSFIMRSSHAVCLTVALLLLPTTAHAYIDPGSGMLLWQGLLAAIGAVILFVRHPILAIKEWWRRLTKK